MLEAAINLIKTDMITLATFQSTKFILFSHIVHIFAIIIRQ